LNPHTQSKRYLDMGHQCVCICSYIYYHCIIAPIDICWSKIHEA